MRVSAVEGDAGYALWSANRRRWRGMKVMLDGVEVRRVITFDTEEGYILRNKTDTDGKLVINGDEFVREELRGTVTVVERTE